MDIWGIFFYFILHSQSQLTYSATLLIAGQWTDDLNSNEWQLTTLYNSTDGVIHGPFSDADTTVNRKWDISANHLFIQLSFRYYALCDWEGLVSSAATDYGRAYLDNKRFMEVWRDEDSDCTGWQQFSTRSEFAYPNNIDDSSLCFSDSFNPNGPFCYTDLCYVISHNSSDMTLSLNSTVNGNREDWLFGNLSVTIIAVTGMGIMFNDDCSSMYQWITLNDVPSNIYTKNEMNLDCDSSHSSIQYSSAITAIDTCFHGDFVATDSQICVGKGLADTATHNTLNIQLRAYMFCQVDPHDSFQLYIDDTLIHSIQRDTTGCYNNNGWYAWQSGVTDSNLIFTPSCSDTTYCYVDININVSHTSTDSFMLFLCSEMTYSASWAFSGVFLRSFMITEHPTDTPTVVPTHSPLNAPTVAPPTDMPIDVPTHGPTHLPTAVPMGTPTVIPTDIPTMVPTVMPSDGPTYSPTIVVPSSAPTLVPTHSPNAQPTVTPSDLPTIQPSAVPYAMPSDVPSSLPTISPSVAPVNAEPSVTPTDNPSLLPTAVPSVNPTSMPVSIPTIHSTSTTDDSQSESNGQTFFTNIDSRLIIVIIILFVVFLLIVIVMLIVCIICMRKSHNEQMDRMAGMWQSMARRGSSFFRGGNDIARRASRSIANHFNRGSHSRSARAASNLSSIKEESNQAKKLNKSDDDRLKVPGVIPMNSLSSDAQSGHQQHIELAEEIDDAEEVYRQAPAARDRSPPPVSPVRFEECKIEQIPALAQARAFHYPPPINSQRNKKPKKNKHSKYEIVRKKRSSANIPPPPLSPPPPLDEPPPNNELVVPRGGMDEADAVYLSDEDLDLDVIIPIGRHSLQSTQEGEAKPQRYINEQKSSELDANLNPIRKPFKKSSTVGTDSDFEEDLEAHRMVAHDLEEAKKAGFAQQLSSQAVGGKMLMDDILEDLVEDQDVKPEGQPPRNMEGIVETGMSSDATLLDLDED